MSIPKAIDILEDILRNVAPYDPPNEHDAIALGIEALQRFQEGRPKNFISTVLLLPGETDA
jgi:hypothetical protein